MTELSHEIETVDTQMQTDTQASVEQQTQTDPRHTKVPLTRLMHLPTRLHMSLDASRREYLLFTFPLIIVNR